MGEPWEQLAPAYDALVENLSATEWFPASGLEVRVGAMQSGRGGRFAQLYRDSWLNEPSGDWGGIGGGVHFESWIYNSDAKRGSFQVALHVETSKSRSGFSRTDLIPRILDLGAEELGQWNDYEVKGKAGIQPLRVHAPCTPDNVSVRLVDELERAARLAPAIDLALSQLG